MNKTEDRCKCRQLKNIHLMILMSTGLADTDKKIKMLKEFEINHCIN